jgi:hypothetical protein
MDTHKFLELYLKKGKTITPNHNSWSWNRWHQFARLTELIDYKCELKKSKCKSSKRERCCCTDCALFMGYLQRIPASWQIIGIIAAAFDEKLGFWRAENGCILERKYRSRVCLLYKCSKLSRAEESLLKILDKQQAPTPGTRAYTRIRHRLLRKKEAQKLKLLRNNEYSD